MEHRFDRVRVLNEGAAKMNARENAKKLRIMQNYTPQTKLYSKLVIYALFGY